MYCEHCGKKIPDEASFCQYCGQKVALLREESVNGEGLVRVPNVKAEPENPIIPDPSVPGGWYYMSNTGKKGPFMKHQMMTFLHDEKIQPSTLVFHEGMFEWRKVRDTELYTETFEVHKSRAPQDWTTKCLAVGICATLIGVLLFFDWFDFYLFKVSILDMIKIYSGEWTPELLLLTLAAGCNLILCIATVISVITQRESWIGAGIGAIVTFVCALFVANSEEAKLTVGPYMVLVLGIIIILVSVVNKD